MLDAYIYKIIYWLWLASRAWGRQHGVGWRGAGGCMSGMYRTVPISTSKVPSTSPVVIARSNRCLLQCLVISAPAENPNLLGSTASVRWAEQTSGRPRAMPCLSFLLWWWLSSLLIGSTCANCQSGQTTLGTLRPQRKNALQHQNWESLPRWAGQMDCE